MKKIIIDNLPLSTGHSIRGMGMYTRNLISSVKNLKQKKYDIVDETLSLENSSNIKADLIHYPYFDLFSNNLPEKKLAEKVVVTVPDVIPLLYPQLYPLGIRGKIKLEKNKRLLKKNADVVITISETSKKDIVRLLDYDPKKVYVTYLAPSFSFKKLTKLNAEKIARKYKLPKKFVLYVGDVNASKNIQTLIKACIKSDVDLVLVGKQAMTLDEIMGNSSGPRDILRKIVGKKHPEVTHFDQLKNLFKSKNVHRLGFISNEELNAIWNLAFLYVQPSLYEGFGLPVLEAMQAGVPVIASKTQTLVEVSGDACLYFETENIDDLSKKIASLLQSKKARNELIKKGSKQVKKYSWKKQAEEVLNVYDLALK